MARKEKKKPNWLDPATTAENEVLPRYAKWGWTTRGVSLAINVVLIMQLTYFCTDMLGMAPTLVGTLLLASKLFDGVTDLVVGYVIDRTHTKFGKARPYEFSIVFVWLFTVLLFCAPELSMTGKAAYVFILYTLINSIFSTFLNGGESVYLSRSFRNQKNRVSVMAFNGAFVMVCSIAASILMPQLIGGIGTTREGWRIIALSFGIPLAVIGLGRFLLVKEVVVDDPAAADSTDSLSLKRGVDCTLKNKYIWILAGMFVLVEMVNNVGTSVNTYYFKYIIGDISKASLVSLSGILTPFIMMVFPVLSRKFGTVRILQIGAIFGVVGYGLRILGGHNLGMIVAGSLIGGVSVMPLTIMGAIYVVDCMDYGEWKFGTRVEGMLNSVTCFARKVGSGFASGVVGLIMGAAGYSSTLETQPASALTSISVLFNFVPFVLMVLLLALSFGFNLEKKLPDIRKELEARKNKA